MSVTTVLNIHSKFACLYFEHVMEMIKQENIYIFIFIIISDIKFLSTYAITRRHLYNNQYTPPAQSFSLFIIFLFIIFYLLEQLWQTFLNS